MTHHDTHTPTSRMILGSYLALLALVLPLLPLTAIGPVRYEFILFGLTPLGVALFHKHKLPTPSHQKVSEIKVSGRIVAAPKLVGERVVEAPKAEEAATEAAEATAKGGKGAGKGPAVAPTKGAAAPAKGAEPAKAEEKKGPAHGPSHAKGGKDKK